MVVTIMVTMPTDVGCRPRWATPRTPERPTFGPQVAHVAQALGFELMPHQRLVLDVGLEVDDRGHFAYREVCVTEPRQSGKTSMLLALATWRATLFARAHGAQRAAYSAQAGLDARRKMFEDWLPILETSELARLLRTVRRSQGSESLVFAGGSRLSPLSNNAGAGHGRVVDLALVDEAFADVDDRREVAMLPAMVTRRDAQLWITSTAGGPEALYLRRKVEEGRAAVERDVRTGRAYFEWSAPDDVDLEDESTWWNYMPALGRTISPDVVRLDAQTMSPGAFGRSYGNQWIVLTDSVLDLDAWRACQVVETEHTGEIHLAVDCPPERTSAVIVAAAWNDGTPTLEVLDRRPGIGWVVGALVEHYQRSQIRTVVAHGAGPIGSVLPELERELGAALHVATESEMTRAAGLFATSVVEHRVRVLADRALDDAVYGARQRKRGDAFTWSRRSLSTDLSPLVAASLALWSATTAGDGGALYVFR
jgi:hypothetical protein